MLQYLIKWLSYPDSNNTWEPAHQIHAPEMIKAYHRQTPLSAIKTLATTEGIQCLTPPLKPLITPSSSLSETSSNTLTPQPLGTPLPPTPLPQTIQSKIVAKLVHLTCTNGRKSGSIQWLAE